MKQELKTENRIATTPPRQTIGALLKCLFNRNSKQIVYNYAFYEHLPEKYYPMYLKKIYREKLGKRLNLDNPKLLTEKIQWLKLYDNIPIKTQLTDKIAVKNWAQHLLPELKTAKVFTSAKSFEELDFSLCPETFMLKTNHSWRQNCLIISKTDFLNNTLEFDNTKKQFNTRLQKHFAFQSGFELQYKNIDRKVFAEEYIGNLNSLLNNDYKIYCFNGKPKLIEHYIIIDRKSKTGAKVALYDINWNKIDVKFNFDQYEKDDIPKPELLDKMLEYASVLSKEFKFVRIDFMINDKDIYLTEMTFTPCSGFMSFQPKKYNEIFGDMLNLKG